MVNRLVEVPFWHSVQRLPVDPEDREVQYTFSNGQCHSLALALHRLTGWPIVILASDDPVHYESPQVAANARGQHAVVQDPQGRMWDIRGPWLPSRPVNPSWRGLHPVPANTRIVQHIPFDKLSVRPAMPFARAVLRLYADKISDPNVKQAVLG